MLGLVIPLIQLIYKDVLLMAHVDFHVGHQIQFGPQRQKTLYCQNPILMH